MTELPGRTARITWIGHSTVLIELAGVRILTDPLLRNRVAHLRRVEPVDTTGLDDLDAVLISHVHYDHLHRASLRQLERDVRLIVPRGAGRVLRRFPEVEELVVGQQISIGGVTVEATRAEHPARRWGRKPDSLGFKVDSVYFAGDTDLFPEMASLRPLDVALVPIWGWGPRAGLGHLDPQRAAQAVALLEPRTVIPIHWGTYHPLYARAPSFLTAPADDFRRAAAELAPGTEVRMLPVGGTADIALAIPR